MDLSLTLQEIEFLDQKYQDEGVDYNARLKVILDNLKHNLFKYGKS